MHGPELSASPKIITISASRLSLTTIRSITALILNTNIAQTSIMLLQNHPTSHPKLIITSKARRVQVANKILRISRISTALHTSNLRFSDYQRKDRLVPRINRHSTILTRRGQSWRPVP